MFVSDNSIQALKKYFQSELSAYFSEREIKSITKLSVLERFQLDENDYILSNALRLSESDLLYFRQIVKRLQKNEPLQYIMGSTFFYGLKLKSDVRGLIPRPETEELVDWVKDTATVGNPKILDLCTGSGCIALALKSLFNTSEIVGVDLSVAAIDLAKENANLTGSNVDFKVLDVLDDDLKSFENFDIWVSNPPYIPDEDRLEMKENVLNYEPHIALFVSDENPLIFYQKIGEKAMVNLSAEGFLFFEIHEAFDYDVCDLLKSQGFVNIQLRKDLQGKPRMIRAQKPKFTT
jgi:release factor glutamine methyltransferase